MFVNDCDTLAFIVKIRCSENIAVLLVCDFRRACIKAPIDKHIFYFGFCFRIVHISLIKLFAETFIADYVIRFHNAECRNFRHNRVELFSQFFCIRAFDKRVYTLCDLTVSFLNTLSALVVQPFRSRQHKVSCPKPVCCFCQSVVMPFKYLTSYSFVSDNMTVYKHGIVVQDNSSSCFSCLNVSH